MSGCQPLTVIVPAGNRVNVIEDCLRSVRWADEVIVVDSFTTDGSLAIARKYADRVLQHEYHDSATQKNWAIPQAAHPWVLVVDTDERVTDALRQEIETVLNRESKNVGYWIPRLNYLLGKPLYHAGYYPDYQVRLFMRDYSRYQDRRVHAHLELDGPCGTLRSPLIHYAHRSIDQTIRNLLVLMTTWEAEYWMSKKKKSKLGMYLTLLLRPVGAFFLRFICKGGWRDGTHGLVVSMIWAMYVAITQMKIWESELALPDRWWEGNRTSLEEDEGLNISAQNIKHFN